MGGACAPASGPALVSLEVNYRHSFAVVCIRKDAGGQCHISNSLSPVCNFFLIVHSHTPHIPLNHVTSIQKNLFLIIPETRSIIITSSPPGTTGLWKLVFCVKNLILYMCHLCFYQIWSCSSLSYLLYFSLSSAVVYSAGTSLMKQRSFTCGLSCAVRCRDPGQGRVQVSWHLVLIVSTCTSPFTTLSFLSFKPRISSLLFHMTLWRIT